MDVGVEGQRKTETADGSVASPTCAKVWGMHRYVGSPARRTGDGGGRGCLNKTDEESKEEASYAGWEREWVK
ncbi:hypothetical protein ColTof4_07362 [Colletotrichum tofieldiae]|nr:hypothetical protein ColTof3_12308 [Colletotrichum tofieldiae]GKT74939.1 hypothetical protein ColTof4_07362 [Colletotrichum tofieldiae]GKT92152.1 hypothetical protein Ct61P_10002 [Colletotrichum tofieldiae]